MPSRTYEIGKRVFHLIPPRFRQRTLLWSYQHLGLLFRGQPHYENWRNNRTYVQTSAYSSHNLVNINEAPLALSVKGSIAVHLHLFYIDLAREFAGYLKNMPFPYDLYVSVASDESVKACNKEFAGLPACHQVKIERVANRGRDIAPVFCTFGEELAGYDYIAHLHSKRSLYNKGATEGWREYLCKNLLGSEDRIRRVFSLMMGEEPCGIVYPQNYVLLPTWGNTWLANRALGETWCRRLGISDIPRGYFDYPASSMFWARGDALAPLFGAGIALEDFPVESGQTDGTLAHTLERLFVLCSLKQGMRPGIIKDDEFPSWSAWRFDRYTDRSRQSMDQVLASSSVKLIAFDVFDTLLCRPLLDPETIKRIVSRRAGGEAGRLYGEYRAVAEQQARDAKGADVGLDAIYVRLGELTGLAQDRLAELRRTEEQVEEASLAPRWEAVQLCQDAVATGKPVALITDMFLPQALIEACLGRHGVSGWDALFVSNQVGLRKDSGDLYRHVLAHYGVEPAGLLMVGDNERSDAQVPCDMGASFLHLLRPVELARGLPRFSGLIAAHERSGDIDAEVTLGLVVRRNLAPIHCPVPDPDSLVEVTPYNLGYSLVGPLLVSFAQWLVQQARADGADKLYFLSREGRLIMQVYDCWTEGERGAPASDYLVISRRAAGVAAISTFEDILDIARTVYFPNTLENLLNTRYGLNLSDARWGEIGQATGWERTSPVSVKGRKIDHLAALLQALQPEILAQAQSERLALVRYLTDKGLDRAGRKTVVDIGYGASVQSYLMRLLSSPVNGYYLMTDERSMKVADTYNVLVRGCFLENARQSSNAPPMYNFSFEVEKLLSSDEEQIECYGINASGNVEGRYRELSPAEAECAGIRAQFRKGALDYAKEARGIRETMLPDFQPSCWTAQMLMDAFLVGQSARETGLLSKIVLDDHYCGRGLVS